jgi:pSer/pThr/pTyr-binding forkhead associated (FHA) protein
LNGEDSGPGKIDRFRLYSALEDSESPRFKNMPRVTITVPEKNAQPYRFQLDREVVTLGRGSENDIAIDCGSISVKHAEMCRIKGGYELRDVGSTNGIKEDGERMEVIPLLSGMSVKLGDVVFDFELSEDEREALEREGPPDESPVRKESGSSRNDLPPLIEEDPVDDSMVDDSMEPDQESRSSGGGGIAMILLFVVLAAAAFVAGLAIRFQKDTNGSWLDAIKSKGQVQEAPAAPADGEE